MEKFSKSFLVELVIVPKNMSFGYSPQKCFFGFSP